MSHLSKDADIRGNTDSFNYITISW